ncbi:MAG: hypothetical protein IJC80_04565, partial [Clostridia bacterium]|nr:hypothetical protein [Clostridia bacterium]
PESGKAYRKILSKYNGFYEKLAEIQPTLKWKGCRIFTPSTPDFTYGRVKEEWDGWSLCVLERLGLPMYFSSEMGGALCLEGDADSRMSNEEILKALKGTVLLASDTAKNLEARGFSKYTGVSVREWQGKTPVREQLSDGAFTKVQMKSKELVPLFPSVEIDSYATNTVDGESYEKLFPAVTVYKNELGGTVITFSGTPVSEFNLVEAFSFLTYSRKKQLIKLLEKTGNLPIYFPGDEEVYLRVAECKGGEYLAAVFNIGLDPIEDLSLNCQFTPKDVSILTPKGEKEKIPFTFENGKISLGIEAKTLDPVVLFIDKQ